MRLDEPIADDGSCSSSGHDVSGPQSQADRGSARRAVLAGLVVAMALALQFGVAGASPSAVGVADTISLRASDVQAVPGWRVLQADGNIERQSNTGLYECVRTDKEPGEDSVAVVQNDTVTDGDHVAYLGSIVVVKPSSIDAARDFAVYRGQTYGRCQTSRWVSMERAGAKVLAADTAALPVTAAGSDGSVGWRASMTVRSPAFPTWITRLRPSILGGLVTEVGSRAPI